MIVSKTRKWGNSLGVIIPREIAKDMKLREDQEVIIEIKHKENVLKELFGSMPKLKEINLKESRRGLESKHLI